MENSKKLIKFYKGYLLKEIHLELSKHNNYSINEIDTLLKYHAQIEKSCADMNYFEMNELITWCFIFGDKIGIYLNFRDNEFES